MALCQIADFCAGGPSTEGPALCLVDDLGREHDHPVIVLVSNNPYALHRLLMRGTRPTLSSGRLGVLVVDPAGDSPRAAARDWSTPRLEVSAPAPVHAGVDGEAADLSPPLRFCHPAQGAAGPDLRPPPGRLAISAPASRRPLTAEESQNCSSSRTST